MAYANAILTILAEPTRQILLDELANGPRTVRALTDVAGVSQPAVSQHLKKLREAGLVLAEPKGASNVYRFSASGLVPVRETLERYWQAALGRYAQLADKEE